MSGSGTGVGGAGKVVGTTTREGWFKNRGLRTVKGLYAMKRGERARSLAVR